MSKHPKIIQRMKARKEQGLTLRELGSEFGISHTHAKRLTDSADIEPRFDKKNPPKEI